MFGFLKTLLGGGESSAEVRRVDGGKEMYAINTGPCEHTEVEERDRTYPEHSDCWTVEDGRLIIEQSRVGVLHCTQCDTDLTWETEDTDTLVFEPSFVFASDVNLDEALDAHTAATKESLQNEGILINREENPIEEDDE